MRRSLIALAALALAVSGCYRVTVNTAAVPTAASTATTGASIQRPFANSFIYGIVPPPEVNTVERCGTRGVSQVVTQRSFLNSIVAIVTSGIWTPIDVRVTCAAP